MSFQEYADSFRSKLRLGDINPKLAIGIGVIVLAISLGVVYTVYSATSSGQQTSVSASKDGFSIESGSSNETTSSSSKDFIAKQICVYVSGCVVSPGVVYLDEGKRVADAIDAAGGMTDVAAKGSLNLARILEDGEQIVVLSTEEQRAALENIPGTGGSVSESSAGSTSAINGKVNINTATSAELQTVSGIGPSKAEKIIAYREANGKFKSVNDLTKVSGIGEKTLESLKDKLCV